MIHTKVAIIGSGPAGYTAAIYTARAQLAPTLLTGHKAGGQLMWTTDIENYPGFKDGIAGPLLMSEMQEQAKKFGTNFVYEYATAVDFSVRPFRIWTGVPEGSIPETVVTSPPNVYKELEHKIKQQPHNFTADAVILTPGAASIMLGVPGEEKLLGKGVSTCAVCDAAFYKDKVTFVVGGGDSAMEEALALTKFAKSVTLVHRRREFRASKIMQDRVLNHPRVQVLWNSTIEEVLGDTKVTAIKVKTGEKIAEYPADGVFVAIGHRPITSPFIGQLTLDDHAYIITKQSLSAAGVTAAQRALNEKKLVSYPSMTSVEGVFAAGDSVDIRYKQAITSAGQGCSAAIDAERWLESQE